MAAPVAKSKATFNGAATPSLTWPSGASAPAAGDIAVLISEGSDSTTAAGTPDDPIAGMTKIYEETQGAGATGVTTLSIWAKICDGTESGTFSVTGYANHGAANLFIISGAKHSALSDILVGTGNGGTSGAGPALGVTTPVNDCLVVAAIAVSQDTLSSTFFTGWTNANLASITEWENNVSSSGAGGGIGVAYGVKNTAGATGDTTVTAAGSANPWRGVHLVFQPDAAAPSSLVTPGKRDQHRLPHLIGR